MKIEIHFKNGNFSVMAQLEVLSGGDYYTVKRVMITEKGKTKGQEYLADPRYFHGSDAMLAYFSRQAIKGGLTVAEHVVGLENACKREIERLFVKAEG